MNALVDKLKAESILKTEAVINALRATDRGNYCNKYLAYLDSPQYIGFGATISAPHMHAFALEYMHPYLREKNVKTLDIGSGSGYLTVCIAQLLGGGGCVIGVEHIPELIEQSIANVNRDHKESLLASKKMRFISNGPAAVLTALRVCHDVYIDYDARKGYPEEAPYHVIHAGAALKTLTSTVSQATDTVLRRDGSLCTAMGRVLQITDQIAPGGLLIAPVGELPFQVFSVVVKDQHGKMHVKERFPVSYVPLTSKEDQIGDPWV